MARHAFFAVLVLSALCFPQKILAVSLELKEYPKEITSEEFTVAFQVVGAKPATNYFRVLLYKDGENSDFAQTWNGSEWYSGSSGKQYFPHTMEGKETEAQVKAKIEDKVTTGDYWLSLKRYTASGSLANDSITPVSVHIVNNIPELTAKPTQKPTPVAVVDVKVAEATPDVLSEATSPPSQTPSFTPQETSPISSSDVPAFAEVIEEKNHFGEYLLAGAGLVLTLVGSVLFVVRLRDWYTK